MLRINLMFSPNYSKTMGMKWSSESIDNFACEKKLGNVCVKQEQFT